MDNLPTTGNHAIDAVLIYVGAAQSILSILGATLPQRWRFTQIVRRLSIDLRGLLGARV